MAIGGGVQPCVLMQYDAATGTLTQGHPVQKHVDAMIVNVTGAVEKLRRGEPATVRLFIAADVREEIEARQ